jgi:hypothetical protein
MKFLRKLKSAISSLVIAAIALVLMTPQAQAASCCKNTVVNCPNESIVILYCGGVQVFGSCTSPDSFVRRVCGQTTGQVGVTYYMAQCNYTCVYIDCSGDPDVSYERFMFQESSVFGAACS